MTMAPRFDWKEIGLVVFDVDGTLYRQRPLRMVMAALLFKNAAAARSLLPIKVLRVYRRLREDFADEGRHDFESALIDETACRCATSTSAVEAIVAEWIDRRPLRYLRNCRYPGVADVFADVRKSRRKIGVLSDYPAEAKLAALGLDADFVLSARDVGALKPSPIGLERLVAAAGEAPETTVLIGDRPERDAEAARRAGTKCLIRSGSQLPNHLCFATYFDKLFDGLREARS